ncbi:MAG TPA: RpiB/LacA/LacB family sugar-phosphate isomerase [Alphaproteobacteria bacterium]|nr:RpiB/LacA/LacB family sugar-phosphate isomerase [Alphaproteobacteria bacterium]
MPNTIIPIAGDHRGFRLKARLAAWLKANGYEPHDLGADSEERCDSIDYAIKMADEIRAHPDRRGVIICGSGNGIAMAANRYKAIRAAVCLNRDMAKAARAHNDANILALGADFMTPEEAIACVEIFLTTEFLGGRYAERRERLNDLGGL